jgi:hypothetical protein
MFFGCSYINFYNGGAAAAASVPPMSPTQSSAYVSTVPPDNADNDPELPPLPNRSSKAALSQPPQTLVKVKFEFVAVFSSFFFSLP